MPKHYCGNSVSDGAEFLGWFVGNTINWRAKNNANFKKRLEELLYNQKKKQLSTNDENETGKIQNDYEKEKGILTRNSMV